MSETRLYYRPASGRPLRVAWALEEIGAPYTAVAISEEECASPEHLGRHPLGRVPVLEVDGLALFDSTALVLHVADLHLEAGLIGPLGSSERALVYQWSMTAMTELEKVAVDHLMANQRQDAAGAGRAAKAFARVGAAYTAALGEREFLVGDSLTAADIVNGGVMAVCELAGLLPGDFPELAEYLERLRSRPGFARAAERTESLFAH